MCSTNFTKFLHLAYDTKTPYGNRRVEKQVHKAHRKPWRQLNFKFAHERGAWPYFILTKLKRWTRRKPRPVAIRGGAKSGGICKTEELDRGHAFNAPPCNSPEPRGTELCNAYTQGSFFWGTVVSTRYVTESKYGHEYPCNETMRSLSCTEQEKAAPTPRQITFKHTIKWPLERLGSI